MALFTVLALVAVLMRIVLLDEPMRYDEAYTFEHYTQHTFRFIASTYDLPNNQILFTLLTHAVWRVFGDQLWTVRLPALVAGVAIVPVTYAVARELYGKSAAIWSAALAATSAPLIDYSVDGRGYSLGVLLILVLVWIGAVLLRRSRSWAWGLFAMCSALAVYTVGTMAAGVATVGLWIGSVAVLGRPAQGRRFVLLLGTSLAIAAALTLLLYEPVLGQAGWTFVSPLQSDLAHIRGLVAGVWENWNRAAPHPLDWLIAVGFGLSLTRHRQLARHPVPLAPAAFVILGGVFLFGPIAPFVRSWLWLLPIYLVMAGAGLAWLAGQVGDIVGHPRLISASALGLVVGILAWSVVDTGQVGAEQAPVSDNNMVRFLKRHLGPGESVALDTFMVVPADYYFRRYAYSPPDFTSVARHRGPGNVLVLMIGHPAPRAALNLLAKLGGRVTNSSHATLLARLDYLSAYDVQL